MGKRAFPVSAAIDTGARVEAVAEVIAQRVRRRPGLALCAAMLCGALVRRLTGRRAV